MRFFTIILILTGIFSCEKKDRYPEIKIFGHAGDGIDISSAPYQENTTQAIEYALNYPEISGVEVDVQWSKDGTPWLYHDEDLSLQTNGEGKIRDKTDQELMAIKYKGLNNEKLTKLVDIISLIGSKTLILDFKSSAVGSLLSLQEVQDGLAEFVSLSSNLDVSVVLQNMDYASYFQSLGWDIYLNANSVSDYYTIPQWENSIGCCVSNSSVAENEVQDLHANDKKVIIFSARAPKTIRKALKKHPDMFLADDIRATLIEKIR